MARSKVQRDGTSLLTVPNRALGDTQVMPPGSFQPKNNARGEKTSPDTGTISPCFIQEATRAQSMHTCPGEHASQLW